MLHRLRELVDECVALVADLDPSTADGRLARGLTEEFARGSRIMSAGLTLMAGRVDDLGAHHGIHRTTAHYVAAVAGITVGAAEQTISTAHRIEELPTTEAALRDGQLSSTQAKEVAAAAAADPSAEHEMLERAQTDGIKGLKSAAARVIAAAAQDEDEVDERIHRERTFRHWRDHDGAGRIDIRGPLDCTARIALALAPYEAEIFQSVKDQDPADREPHQALMFNAMLALADASAGEMPKGTGPRPTVIVRVDHRALRAGETRLGEVCEIAGLGPVPVSVVQRLAEDAYVKALITTGKDVLSVAHLGRTIPAHLSTALDDLFPECAVEGCHVSWGLEIDHNQPVELGGPTAMWNLNKVCRYHHRYKHRHDLRLIGEGTRKRFVPAAEWVPPNTDPVGRRRTAAPLAAA